ncbi:ATP-binding protein [Streptomyces sp. NPDC057682]|uniref:ATP-binding protein n=1 Tax=Streptomyces sp. NPDC057682 TaxID=3346210 RepID=UPI0036C5808D
MTALSSREFLAVLSYGNEVERVTVEIESCERNVGAARRFARQQLVRWGMAKDDELIDRVLLVVSELVTNAVVHGRLARTKAETVEVALALRRGFALGVMVADSSCGTPQMRIRPSSNSSNGRGLLLVNAASDRWTATSRRCDEDAGGKAVWAFFEIPRVPSAPQPMPQSA